MLSRVSSRTAEANEDNTVEACLFRFEDVDSTSQLFDYIVEQKWSSSRTMLAEYTYGGKGEDRYCYSYVKQLRGDPEGLNWPMGVFESFVVFQKENLIIFVEESSGNKRGNAKDEALEEVATILERITRR